MKKSILILFAVISLSSFAQKTKTETLLNSNMQGKILMMTTFDADNNVVEKNMVLLNRDSRYRAIYESVVIYSGSAEDLLVFLTEIEQFCNDNEPDVQTKIHGRSVNFAKMLGYKAVIVFDKDNIGYHDYRVSDIKKLKKWMENWVSDNG